MQNLALVLGFAVAGAVIGWSAAKWFESTDVRPPLAGIDELQPPAHIADPAVAVAAWTVGDQLERLTARLAALEKQIADLPSRLPTRVALDAAPAAVDGEALLTAIEQATERRERHKLESMTDAALLAESNRLLNARDATAARRAIELLLARPLAPADRAAAMTQLGIADREAGNLEASQRTLQEAVDTFGVDSAEGAWAAFQLLWTVRRQGDANHALTLADAVAGSAQANEALRLHGRWLGAQLAQELGNLTRARIEFAAILREFADRPDYESILQDCKTRLAGL